MVTMFIQLMTREGTMTAVDPSTIRQIEPMMCLVEKSTLDREDVPYDQASLRGDCVAFVATVLKPKKATEDFIVVLNSFPDVMAMIELGAISNQPKRSFSNQPQE